MRYADAKIAGVALFLGSVQFVFGMVLAEIYYPNYSVSLNYISDLGATCRTTCQVFQPASNVFNSSIVILGALVLVTAYFLHHAFKRKILSLLVAITGVGALGVGLFPETTGYVHSIFSLVTFLFSGFSAIVAYKVQRSPLSYLSVVLGGITLIALVLYTQNIYLGLGNGGMERMIVYPVLLWAVGFGGHLISRDAPT